MKNNVKNFYFGKHPPKGFGTTNLLTCYVNPFCQDSLVTDKDAREDLI